MVSTRQCHMPQPNMTLLQETFPGHVIPRYDHNNWPPRSCDLTTLNFFVGLCKDLVNADKPSNIKHLKTNIRQVMAEILPNMCQKVVEKLASKKSMLATLCMEVI